MQLTGKIIAILPARSGVSQKSGNSWTTQQYVLEVPGQYPRRMVFEVFGEERIRQFNIQMGCQYNVSFDIDASEYQGRWYNSVKAFSVVAITPSAAVPATMPTTMPAAVPVPAPAAVPAASPAGPATTPAASAAGLPAAPPAAPLSQYAAPQPQPAQSLFPSPESTVDDDLPF